jgi:hypothetical protein
MEKVKEWYVNKLCTRTVKALQASYFDALFFASREELNKAVLDQVTPSMIVGLGGAVTLRDLGLPALLAGKDAVVLDAWREGLTKEEGLAMRKEHLTCDLFLTSTNAVTEKGELVNIDGTGNRINAMTFGPKKVIVIVGFQKIVPDVDRAIERIKQVAAPMNARRLSLPLPCAETGYCHDCKSEVRICRVISIMQRRPNSTPISVYILGEEIGY